MNIIGIQANIDKTPALAVAEDAFKILKDLGATPVYECSTARVLGKETIDCDERLEALLVIGGDGTILRSAVKAARHDIPMLGVNLGKKGFLTDVEISELSDSLRKLRDGAYTIEERMMLQGELQGSDGGSWLALNDFLIFKDQSLPMIQVDIAVNGQLAGQYACDGIIVSTPTGSTAYSLSAGGPVIAPCVKGILITLICPHSLSARPMLIGEDDVVTVVAKGANNIARISADGQPKSPNFEKDRIVTIRRAKQTSRFIHVGEYNFFDLVLKKLY